jgi:hypothetical protein
VAQIARNHYAEVAILFNWLADPILLSPWQNDLRYDEEEEEEEEGDDDDR